MHPAIVELKDGFRWKGLMVVTFSILSASIVYSVARGIIEQPNHWLFWSSFLVAIPFSVCWPALPNNFSWPEGRSHEFSAYFTALQLGSALAMLSALPHMPAPARPFVGGIIFPCYLAGLLYSLIGLVYVVATWRETTGRVRAYVLALGWGHPMEKMLRRAIKEGRDLTPGERLQWEVYLANRMMEQGEFAPVTALSEVHAARATAAAHRIENETKAAAAALGRMRVAHMERVMSHRPPHTQEG